jgi:hypothetical protein
MEIETKGLMYEMGRHVPNGPDHHIPHPGRSRPGVGLPTCLYRRYTSRD